MLARMAGVSHSLCYKDCPSHCHLLKLVSTISCKVASLWCACMAPGDSADRPHFGALLAIVSPWAEERQRYSESPDCFAWVLTWSLGGMLGEEIR